MWRLAEILPQRAQDMVMGVSTYSSGHVGHTTAAVAATAGAVAAGLAGAGVATKAAYQLAQAQITQRSQTGGGQSPGFAQRAAMTTGLMARNLGSAAAHDIDERMVGRNRFGHRSWHMAEDLKHRTAATKKGSTP